ncbi:Uncharacterized protein OBRU01_02992 [Operophtera brumata]|uniref:Phosphoglucomutase n=1 Tax=Operophtera brumata TaxID=104452 RepID=A0A0L7LRS0_OPEBR|nr:Uncharacterized protein OBRU01_02992 [Operophtera brumata]
MPGVVIVDTNPFEGQKPGTSGLRKKVKVFLQKNYTENFIQSILDANKSAIIGSTLVVGGDGRYLVKEVVDQIIKISAANGVSKLIVGQNGILSTPAFNCSNGGPAPDNTTNDIYKITTEIKQYKIVPDLVEDQPFTVEVIDSVNDYVLGAPESAIRRSVPLEDFGGAHPDPNLTYAADLVNAVKEGDFDFGAAFDGDDHVREKDGLWAALAWLSVLAATGRSVEDVLKDHWAQFGRNYFTRYDYEECASDPCNEMMQVLEKAITAPGFIGSKHASGGKTYVVKTADNFSYMDPIDRSVAMKQVTSSYMDLIDRSVAMKQVTSSYMDLIDRSVAMKQGLRVVFEDGSRVVLRLSGTGSSGATVRYVLVSCRVCASCSSFYEFYILLPINKDTGPAQRIYYLNIGSGLVKCRAATGHACRDAVALQLSKLPSYTGRDAPTVIT